MTLCTRCVTDSITQHSGTFLTFSDSPSTFYLCPGYFCHVSLYQPGYKYRIQKRSESVLICDLLYFIGILVTVICNLLCADICCWPVLLSKTPLHKWHFLCVTVHCCVLDNRKLEDLLRTHVYCFYIYLNCNSKST